MIRLYYDRTFFRYVLDADIFDPPEKLGERDDTTLRKRVKLNLKPGHNAIILKPKLRGKHTIDAIPKKKGARRLPLFTFAGCYIIPASYSCMNLAK